MKKILMLSIVSLLLAGGNTYAKKSKMSFQKGVSLSTLSLIKSIYRFSAKFNSVLPDKIDKASFQIFDRVISQDPGSSSVCKSSSAKGSYRGSFSYLIAFYDDPKYSGCKLLTIEEFNSLTFEMDRVLSPILNEMITDFADKLQF